MYYYCNYMYTNVFVIIIILVIIILIQMYLMLDALADGGVWAGVPKDLALRMIAQTMLVG